MPWLHTYNNSGPFVCPFVYGVPSVSKVMTSTLSIFVTHLVNYCVVLVMTFDTDGTPYLLVILQQKRDMNCICV